MAPKEEFIPIRKAAEVLAGALAGLRWMMGTGTDPLKLHGPEFDRLVEECIVKLRNA